MKKLSLRSRILLPIIALIIIGLVVTNILTTRSTISLVETNIEEQLQTLTKNLSAQAAFWVTGLKKDLAHHSKSPTYSTTLAKFEQGWAATTTGSKRTTT